MTRMFSTRDAANVITPPAGGSKVGSDEEVVLYALVAYFSPA